ncbi:glutathione S-transferase domain-containing protein [Ochrobactrum sp. Q0168]|uniref:glutathione S-transferase N-terminal domain-containing protein n=1 Tax=Ochrobactrum sp. Q0168 TaxID=2793241 RepID=UPI0018EBF315|nr:glutathione S-transferase domain-containing protein [Ochrobactrum sp. Q0168]
MNNQPKSARTRSDDQYREPEPNEETGGVTGALGKGLSETDALEPASRKPVIYLKRGCPFCFKLRLALLEAGMLDSVELIEFAEGTAEQAQIRDKLSRVLEDLSFPAAEIQQDKFMKESDRLIEYFLDQKGLEAEALPTLQSYIHGPLAQLLECTQND